MANKLNPELVKNISDLMTVKKISDLPIIDVIDKDNETTKIRTSQQFNNSYLLSSTLLEDNSYVGGRYFNYRVKLNEVTEYLSTLSDENLTAFKQTFNFFVDSLKNNTENSYVQFAPANDTIDTENADNNYSYTFRYKLSEVLDDVIGFTYNITSDGIEEISTYSYTNVLTEGLVTNATLEKYVRNSIANILGVPSSPAQLSEAIDSVIEFVDWFKGYVRNDTSYGSLHQLISTIEAKDSTVLNEAKSYTVENKELSYAYTETSYNKLYGTLNNALNNITIKPIAGTNISIGEDNSINCNIGIGSSETFTVGGIKYALQFENGKFSIAKITNPYSSFTFTEQSGTSSNGEFEYNGAGGTITIKGKPNKNCKITTLDNVSGNIEDNNIALNTEINADTVVEVSGSYLTNENKTFTIGATMSTVANDGGFTPTEKSITKNVNFNKYKIFCFTSSSTIDNISINETDNQPDIIGTNNVNTKLVKSLPGNPLFTFKTTSAGYLYLLIPTDTRNGKPNWKPTKPIKWTGTESIGDTPEGNDRVKQISLYNNSINYTLYRSYLSYPQNTDISLKIE